MKRAELVTKEDKKGKVSTPATGSKQDKMEKATKIEILNYAERVLVKVDRTFSEYTRGDFCRVAVNRIQQKTYSEYFKVNVSDVVLSFETLM